MQWILIPVILTAAFISGLSGFGYGIIAMAVLPLFIGLLAANVVVSMSGLLMFILLTVPLRKDIQWRALLYLSIGMAAGVPIGVYGLVALNENLLLLLLGLIILFYVLYSSFLSQRWHLKLNLRYAFPAGFLGGLIAGALSSGGPPVIIFCSAMGWNKRQFKATIQSFLILVIVYKLVLFVITGVITRELWVMSLLYSPIAIGATLVGMMVFKYLRDRTFRWIVLGVLFVMAVILIGKSLGVMPAVWAGEN